ncbi:MAG: capsule biosynthesis protein CapC [Kangiella sp.]|nr:MAG: capsule biosynthesis protein CapC [Kangiella sp.]
MIDIHSHLIPNIDDGSDTLEESLTLLKMAADDGITRMVLTPHIHLGRYINTRTSIQFEYTKLKRAVADKGINIELAFAAEVRLDSEIIALVEEKDIPLFGPYDNKQYLLLELPHGHIPVGTTRLIEYLISLNIVPIIAHPERNRELLKAPVKITQIARSGCLFQITAGSIVGKFGAKCEALAIEYLEQGFAFAVATDAHNVKHRPPILSDARRRVVKLLGESIAQDLFYNNPNKISRMLFD